MGIIVQVLERMKIQHKHQQVGKTTKTDSNWYSYNGDIVNAPKLVGKMTPIKYNLELPSGANTTNKWAKCNNCRWKHVGMDSKICMQYYQKR